MKQTEARPSSRTRRKPLSQAAPESAAGPAPGQSIGFLLQRAHTRLRESLNRVLDGTGIHLGHIAILGFLAKEPALTQRDLSAKTGIEKSSMVIFLDHLELEGWVRRQDHPTDRRAHLVSLTGRGTRRLAAIGPRLQQAEVNFLSKLSKAEQRSLQNQLLRLSEETKDIR